MNGRAQPSAPAAHRWEPIVVAAARTLPQARVGVHLRALYSAVEAECGRRGRSLPLHWAAKVRQVVQRSVHFESVSKGSGVWRLTGGDTSGS